MEGIFLPTLARVQKNLKAQFYQNALLRDFFFSGCFFAFYKHTTGLWTGL